MAGPELLTTLFDRLWLRCRPSHNPYRAIQSACRRSRSVDANAYGGTRQLRCTRDLRCGVRDASRVLRQKWLAGECRLFSFFHRLSAHPAAAWLSRDAQSAAMLEA